MITNPLQYKASKIPQPNTIPVAGADGKIDPEWGGGGGNDHYLGYFLTPTDLPATGEAGDYAIVGSTDTFWVWDTDSNSFVDTANAPASDYLGMYATIADLPTTANPGEYATVKETNSFWYYDTAWIDTGDLSIHSVTELSDVTDAGSGKIITDAERDAIGNFSNPYDITVHNYAELKSACEDGSYKKIFMEDGVYTFANNVDTDIIVHSNVTRITGRSSNVIWDVDMDGANTNLVTAIKINHLCLLEVFTLRNVKHKNGTEFQHRGIIEGDVDSFDQNSTVILPVVKRLFLDNVLGDTTLADTNYIVAGCTLQDTIVNTQYIIGLTCKGNRIFNVTVHNPQIAFNLCYDVLGCRAENTTNVDPKSGHGFINCDNTVACEAIYVERGFQGGKRASSCYSYACTYGFVSIESLASCIDSGSTYGFENCIDVDETTCTSSSATPYRGCTFNRKQRADEATSIPNSRVADFDFSEISENATRVFAYPDKSGHIAISEDYINPVFRHVTIEENIRFVRADSPHADGMNMIIGRGGQIEAEPPLTKTIEFSDSDVSTVNLTTTTQEVLSVAVTEDIPKQNASFVVSMMFDNNDTQTHNVHVDLRKNGNIVTTVTTKLMGGETGHEFVYPGGFIDDASVGDVYAVYVYADFDGVTQIRGDVYESILKIRKTSSLVEDDIPWTENNDLIEPKNINADVKLPRLSGIDNSVPVTDVNGITKDTPVQIEEISGGDILNMRAWSSEPTNIVEGDVYIVDKDVTTKTLKYFDGIDTFAIDLTKI